MATELIKLTNEAIKHKVSSTSNNNSSKNMFLDDDSTCWNSGQGMPQYVIINFPNKVKPTKINIMFQGGFVGIDVSVETGNSLNKLMEISKFEPEDINSMQSFEILYEENNEDNYVEYLKLIFNASSDFYGRIIIYKLEVFGCEYK